MEKDKGYSLRYEDFHGWDELTDVDLVDRLLWDELTDGDKDRIFAERATRRHARREALARERGDGELSKIRSVGPLAQQGAKS